MEGDGLFTAELEKRLSLTTQRKVPYEVKAPSRDGSTQVIFEPLHPSARLVTLVPSCGLNLTC
jgi:hypothetical protein